MMNQEQYKTVLESRLIPQLKDWAQEKGLDGTGDLIFMHDGAPCHRGKKVTNFLREQAISVLAWPGNSPDMNPIENLWYILKAEMKKKKITTKQQLIEELIAAWARNSNMTQHCKELIDSMPSRIKALRKSRGSFTKY